MKEKDDKNTTEDLLRQKLQGFELPVEESVFGAIQSEINLDPLAGKKKNRRLGVLLLALLLTLGVVLVGLFYPFENQSEQETPSPKPLTEKPGLPNTLNSVGTDARASEETTDTKSIPETGAQDIGRTEALPASTYGKTSPVTSSPTKTKSGTEKASAVAIASSSAPGESEPVLAQNSKPVTDLVPPEVKRGEGDKTLSAAGSKEKPEAESRITSVQPLNPAESENEEPKTSAPESLPLEDTPMGMDEPASLLPEEEEAASPSRFTLIARGGAGFSYRTLRIKPNEDLQTHKNQHERSGLTFNYALGLRYSLSPKMYLATGLGYASFSERYAFHHDVINHTTVNTYDYLQVPVILGLRIWHSKNIALYGQLGVVWNSLTAAQSSWVDPDNLTAVSHSNNGAQHPFQDNTFEGMGGFDLSFALNNRWKVHIMPQAGIFLNSIYLQSTNLEQKPYAGSLNLGISRKF